MEDSFHKYLPTPEAFTAVQSAGVEHLDNLSSSEVRYILPTLVRASYCNLINSDESFRVFQNKIQMKISDDQAVDNILSVLKINFGIVQDDVLKEQHLRRKLASIEIGNNLLSESMQNGLLLEFEESDALKRTRLVLSEIIRISALVQDRQGKCFEDDTELFEHSVYLEEISDILCIAFAELPYLLTAPDVSEALLHVKLGPWILCKIVANNPDCFDIVCSSILSHAKTSDDSSDVDTQLRIKTLKMLCHMNPHYVKILRAECVSLCKLAGLAIELSVTGSSQACNSDLVSFFTGLLLASNSKTREWLSEFIKTAQKDNKENVNTFSLFKQQLLKEMRFVIDSIKVNKEETIDEDISDESDKMDTLANPVMHGIAMLRLFCTLKTISGFKFNHEESEMLIDLIVCLPPPTALGVRYVVVSLCTLVACAFLLSTQEREEKITKWLRSLIERSSTFQAESESGTSYGETLLLIAIHFHGHSLEPIVDLVCSTLGIKLRPASLTKLKILFTQAIFPEKVVAEHALTVPVTRNLNRCMKTFLPAHCIHQLMKSRVFTKHTITVKDWLFKQICTCSRPIHPLMMDLIESYVHAIVNFINISKTKHQRMSALSPFSEDDMLCVFNNSLEMECSDRLASQILLMMYSLMYQNALLENMKTLVNNPNAPSEYSTLLYSSIPMKQILIQARSNEEAFGPLYPPMLRLLATHYPHLCLVEDWIAEEEELSVMSTRHSIRDVGETDESSHMKQLLLLRHAISELDQHPQRLLMQLVKLTLLNPNQLIPFNEEIVNLLPALLEVHVPRKVQLVVLQLWMKLNTVIPRRLLLKTVNVLRRQPDNVLNEWEKVPEYADEEIQKDPLIVLRCNSKVYRCPPLFDILLRTLRGYLTASRALLNHHILSNPLTGMRVRGVNLTGHVAKPLQQIMSAEKDREELKSALVSAQESAALQILLEVCIPTEAERKTSGYTNKSTLREIQCQVCCFLHQSFISDPSMAKLIHFQGYSPDLLPVTVSGIPSMHICIDFIPELTNQPYTEKQLFAVQLISHLALQYPIPKSFAMSRYVVQRMDDMLAALPVAKRNQFFVPALKCLARISKAFPPVREEVTELVLKIGRVSMSQVNKASLISIPYLKLSRDKKLKEGEEEDEGGENMKEEDFEMDIETDEKHQSVNSSTEVKTILDGDNPACTREGFMKYCTSKQLTEEVEKIFSTITNYSLRDKLVLLEDEKLSSR